ncbi:MAG: hypothetical protein JNM85_02395 [Chthonomonas sp.]|nr:hypothetical protein [Chthonomonas sp.]
MIKLNLSVLFVAALVVSAQAELRIGPKVGAFQPTAKKTRDALGSTWFGFGFGPVDTRGSTERSQIGSDFRVLTRNSRGNRFLMISPSYGPTITLGDPNSQGAVPYVAFRVGPSYFDYGIGTGAARVSKKRLGYNLNMELGATLSNAGRLALRYDRVSRFDGYNFDGLSLEFMFSIGRF